MFELCSIQAFVIVLILILIHYCQHQYYYTTTYFKFLNGYWKTTDEFNKSAGINNASVCIRTVGGNKIKVYFWIQGDDEVILNDIIEFSVDKRAILNTLNMFKSTVDFNITTNQTDDIQPLKSKMKLKLDLVGGHIALLSQEKDAEIQLDLIKDNNATTGIV